MVLTCCLAVPLPYDGLVRPQADGSEIAYMAPPNLANHAATLEQLPDGALLLAWFSGIKEEADKCAIVVSRLPPGSAQWTPPVTVSERNGYSNQNPVLFHDASTNVTWLFHSQLAAGAGEGLDNLWVLQSSDSGVTWSKPSIFLDFSADKKGVFDRNRIIPRADGSLLFPLYWTTTGPPNAPFMLTSEPSDHSKWGKPIDVKAADNLVQPTVVRTSASTLTAFFRDRKSKNIFAADSKDEGLTWTTPTPTRAGNLPNNVSSYRLSVAKAAHMSTFSLSFCPPPPPLTHTSKNAGIEAFQLASGKTILLFNNSTKDRTPMTAALSSTGGTTWSRHRNLQLHDDNSTSVQGVEFSYPTVLQTPDGKIHAAYTYNRQTIKYVAFSEDWIQ